MRTTIDQAGRLVIPKALRDRIGLRPGPAEVTVEGAALKIEPVADDAVERRGDRLVIPPSGVTIDDADVRALRDADRR